jgi:hypothetical protein
MSGQFCARVRITSNMTLHRKLLLGIVIVAAGLFAPAATSQAQSLHIEIGDRPYYTRGPGYWENDVRYVWVPGHRSPRGYWIKGHYVARERRSPLRRLQRRHELHRKWLLGR